MARTGLFPAAVLIAIIAGAYLLQLVLDDGEPEPGRPRLDQETGNASTPELNLQSADEIQENHAPESTRSDSAATSSSQLESIGSGVSGGEFTVFGKVIDENGQPVENAQVTDDYQLANTRTDSDGWYQIKIEFVQLKTPFLNFRRAEYKQARIGIEADDSGNPSKVEVDVMLQPATNTTTVDGWLGNESGVGLGGFRIAIRSKGLENSNFISYAVISDESGEFSFEGIRSDHSYRLRIETSDNYVGYTLDPFWVPKQSSRITIILDSLRLVEADGMIVDTNNLPVANFSINVQNLTTDFPARTISSDSSGFFKLEAFPPGELKLSTNTPDYFKITGLSLRANEYRTLKIVIDKGPYHLSGWVSDEYGAPLEKARVTLNSVFPIDDYQSYSYRSVPTDSNGGFEFTGLGGQGHTVSVYAKGFQTYILNHEFTTFSDNLQIRLTK